MHCEVGADFEVCRNRSNEVISAESDGVAFCDTANNAVYA